MGSSQQVHPVHVPFLSLPAFFAVHVDERVVLFVASDAARPDSAKREDEAVVSLDPSALAVDRRV
jgi:hypothetical protein